MFSFDPHEMSLNIDMKMIRPVKSSGVSFHLDSNSCTLWQSCNVVNPGKIFHSNSIGSPSIVSKVLHCGELLNHVHLSSHNLIVGSGSSYQGITQNLKIRKPLRARDWRLLHHQPKINTSMKNLPVNCIHSIDLVWLFGYQLFRNVEHLFHCEIVPLYFWWNVNCLSNSFPWIQMLPMSKT